MFDVRWLKINDARVTNDGVLVARILLADVFERARLSRDVLGRCVRTHVLPQLQMTKHASHPYDSPISRGVASIDKHLDEKNTILNVYIYFNLKVWYVVYVCVTCYLPSDSLRR